MYSGLDTIDNNVTEPKLGNHIVWSYSNNSSETSPLILQLFYTFVEMGKKRFHSFKYPFPVDMLVYHSNTRVSS